MESNTHFPVRMFRPAGFAVPLLLWMSTMMAGERACWFEGHGDVVFGLLHGQREGMVAIDSGYGRPLNPHEVIDMLDGNGQNVIREGYGFPGEPGNPVWNRNRPGASPGTAAGSGCGPAAATHSNEQLSRGPDATVGRGCSRCGTGRASVSHRSAPLRVPGIACCRPGGGARQTIPACPWSLPNRRRSGRWADRALPDEAA